METEKIIMAKELLGNGFGGNGADITIGEIDLELETLEKELINNIF